MKEIKNYVIKYTIPAVYVFLMNLFFIGINYKFWCPILGAKGFVIEIIIVYSAYFLLWGISGKWKTVITFFGFFSIVLSIINQIKYLFTSEPILWSDLLFIRNSKEIIQIIQGDFWNVIKLCLIPIIFEILIFLLCIKIGRNAAKDEKKINKWARISIIAFSLMIFLILFCPIPKINEFMKNKIYDINNRKDYDTFTEISVYYLDYGIIGGAYGQMLENRLAKPEEYDEKQIDIELSNAKENEKKTLGTPNIIVVFSESFWDIEQLDEVEFNTKVTSNFNSLKEKGLFFNMISPSYGGVSANVEYEFLTGSNTMFFNHSYIPYMSLYKDDTYYNRPSIIKELKDNGYRTKIVTYTSSKLFNCGKVYKYLQVDDVEYNINIDEKYKKGENVSDEYVVDKIIKEFDKKNKDEKLFYMTLTMQAHMPYTKDKYDKYDVWVTKSNLSNQMNDVLTSYAQRNL